MQTSPLTNPSCLHPDGLNQAGRNKRVRIQRCTRRNLVEFVNQLQASSQPGDLKVISPHRAKAYSLNPCASDEDSILLVAFQEEQPLGFLGVMPGKLKLESGTHRVHWLSTWHVPVQARHTGAGIALMMTAISLKYDLVASAPNMGSEAQRVYRGLGFKEMGPLEFCVLDCDQKNWMRRSLGKLTQFVQRHHPSFRIPGRLERGAITAFSPRRRKFWNKVLRHEDSINPGRLRCKEIAHFDTTIYRDSSQEAPSFVRDPEILNWMLDYKWILDRPVGKRVDESYFFSSYRNSFTYLAVSFHDPSSEECKGFAVLSISREKGNSVIKLLDFQFHFESLRTEIVRLMMKHAARVGATQVILPADWKEDFENHPLLSGIRDKGWIHCFGRPAAPDTPLARGLARMHLTLFDGDLAFY